MLHLAYPYGDRIAAGPREFRLARAAGFKTAVTTRPGMIFPESAEHLTALQRVSLNGNYQDERILPVLTSGAATAMWNGFRRIDAACLSSMRYAPPPLWEKLCGAANARFLIRELKFKAICTRHLGREFGGLPGERSQAA